jgi:large subunit ribosomal protein L29
MKLKELKEKKIEDLQQLLVDWGVKLQELNFRNANGQLKNVRELRLIKKNIARSQTLINQHKVTQ